LPYAPSDSNPSELVRKADQKAYQQADESESDSNSEVGAQELALTLKGKGKANGIKAFEQRDLVAAAFAGDNVIQVRPGLSGHLLALVIDRYYSSQNFEEAKSREIASDAPREVDTTIPGWVRVNYLSLVRS
jgi:U3 small nucleolar RNA-associated protein 14